MFSIQGSLWSPRRQTCGPGDSPGAVCTAGWCHLGHKRSELIGDRLSSCAHTGTSPLRKQLRFHESWFVNINCVQFIHFDINLQGKVEQFGSCQDLILRGVDPSKLLGLKEEEKEDEFAVKNEVDEGKEYEVNIHRSSEYVCHSTRRYTSVITQYTLASVFTSVLGTMQWKWSWISIFQQLHCLWHHVLLISNTVQVTTLFFLQILTSR